MNQYEICLRGRHAFGGVRPITEIYFKSKNTEDQIINLLIQLANLVDPSVKLSERDKEFSRIAFIGKNQHVINLPEPAPGHEWTIKELDRAFNNSTPFAIDYGFRQVKIKTPYNWKNTADHVHVRTFDEPGKFFILGESVPTNSRIQLADHWQSHGFMPLSPIDVESCFVSIMDKHGKIANRVDATHVIWGNVASWKFDELKPNVNWFED